MYCPKCGHISDGSAASCPKCGSQLPVSIPPGAPAAVATGVYAGFWIRLAAVVIDAVVLVALSALVGGIFGAIYGVISGAPDLKAAETMGNIVGIIVWWLYYACLESSGKQATPGKLALRIKVVDLQGGRISFGRATGRHFAKIVSGMILLIGYVLAGLTGKKQALHDMMAGCLVVKRDAPDALIRQGVTDATMPAWAAALVVLAVGLTPVATMALIGVPVYQDMMTRNQVASALLAGKVATQGIEDYYKRYRALPADLKQAGVPDASSSIVRQVSMDPRSGAVLVVLALPSLQGKSILLTPKLEGESPITWTCSSPDVLDKYLPAACRK